LIELSVVIPVYQCADCLVKLHQRLQKVLSGITDHYEILFVEDRGRDHSWEVLKKIARKDHHVRAYRLSRNFGQHSAITAGLSQCSGRWAVVMDCDLQDSPEVIPQFYEKAEAGYDIVFAKRKRKKQFFLKRILAFLYFKGINFFNQSHIDRELGTFSIISRKVIDSFLKVGDRDRHYLFILYWLGFKSTSIEYEHAERLQGKSSYNFWTLANHAFNGLFFQTTVLLRWIVYLGFGLSALGTLYALFIIYQYFFKSILPGWPSLSVLILVVGGFIITSTGITGLYIGKIFEQVKGRSLFVIDRSIIRGVEK
jgi:glycosyltransferase involved in cell wall biosynthesis